MSQYIQLLGTDTPDSYGGCCYYGHLANESFQVPTATRAASLARQLRYPLMGGAADPAMQVVEGSGEEGYIFFNCPEGAQRFSSEASIKLKKVRGFFFTRWGGVVRANRAGRSTNHQASESSVPQEGDAVPPSSSSTYASAGAASAVMGLPGLLFTINDAGVRHASFFGPSSAHQLSRCLEAVWALTDPRDGYTSVKPPAVTIENGLERFLAALRKSYFTYRPMTFQVITPVYLPRVTGWRAAELSEAVPGVSFTHQQDSVYPLFQSTSTAIACPGPCHPPPRIVAVMPLSAHSAVVAFHISGNITWPSVGGDDAYHDPMPTLLDLSDVVLGYAVVIAPPEAFDVQKAKALGVRPGPKYSQLKHGTAVYADTIDPGTSEAVGGRKRYRPTTSRSPATEVTTTASLTPEDMREEARALPRLVQPWETTTPTVASRHLYVSLVLDGDTPEEVQSALTALFGCGALDAALAAHCPHLLLIPSSDSMDGLKESGQGVSGVPLLGAKRHVVIRHVTHVQPRSYFMHAARGTLRAALCEEEAADENLAGVYRAYSAFVTMGIPAMVHCTSDVMLKFTLKDATDPASCHHDPFYATRHLFTAQVQTKFTAFPTALVHRYHLNAVRAACFPVPASRDAGGTAVEHWPYTFKFRCIPHDGLTRCSPESRTKNEMTPGGLGPTALVADGPSVHVRYPERTTAMQMLSTRFRQLLSGQHGELPPQSRTTGPGLLHDEEGGGCVGFLGTGSAVPSKYRNVSGTFLELHLPAWCFGRRPASEADSQVLTRGVVVLDYGEGSSGQLWHLVSGMTTVAPNEGGTAQCKNWAAAEAALGCFLHDLELIFISHGHADHHLGLLSLLTLRHAHRSHQWPSKKRKLLVVLPEEVYEFMESAWFHTVPYVHWVFEECQFECIPRSAVIFQGLTTTAQHNCRCTSPEVEPETLHGYAGEVPHLPHLTSLCRRWNKCIQSARPAAPGGCKVWWDAEVFKVDHPANAHALLLRFPFFDRHKGFPNSRESEVFLFSGDTRPSAYLVERTNAFCHPAGSGLALGPLICLHEATFGPGYEEEAIRKKHSTLPEALSIGKQTHSQFVLVNHFSQRYPKLPGLTAAHLCGSTVDLECRRRGKTTPDPQVVAATATPAEEGDMCFAFDIMRLSFSDVRSGEVTALLPTLVQLLEEYESWGEGTTQRLRN